jgi:2-keto-4-pentenoate hydratase/2-oxohepta-3-ene-1,7-dioic acid hydratase in catechol pathway
MRLVTFSSPAGSRLGAIADDSVVDLRATDPELPGDILGLVRAGEVMWERARRAAEEGKRVPLSEVRLLAPIVPPRNIFLVGKNYRAHASEFAGSGFDASAKEVEPDVPVIFTKPPSTICGPGDPIHVSHDPDRSVDYEGELTVVIGRGGRRITRQDAMSHVFGYTIVNDVTAREMQKRHRQWFLGKSVDGFCPMGPAIVTADEIPDPAQLHLLTEVNGERRQDAPVSDLIFDIPCLIETISSVCTLEPGDLIATGTAAGVGIGFDPPKYLKPGDVVRITIEPIGTLENPVEE